MLEYIKLGMIVWACHSSVCRHRDTQMLGSHWPDNLLKKWISLSWTCRVISRDFVNGWEIKNYICKYNGEGWKAEGR